LAYQLPIFICYFELRYEVEVHNQVEEKIVTHSNVEAALTFLVQGKSKVGAERIALLQAIGQTGSLSQAAKDLGLSYKGAWDAVKVMNNMLPNPVVVMQAGGRYGGESILTEDGRRMISAFTQLQAELGRFSAQLCKGSSQTLKDKVPFMEGLFMRTSARNMLRGTVSALISGAVNAEVHLKVSDQVELVAIITEPSVIDLDLKVGSSAIALIKSSFVILALDHPGARLSARNQIKGVISHIEEGAVNAEISVDIGQDKTITAIVTRHSVEFMELEPGCEVICCIKASHIILVVE
jgi:molybdate transport system regulatory protein